MNWKHFLRGLGAGIIFSTLIVLVAYMTSGSYKISDEEVIARAEKLGMVMRDGSIISDNASETDADAEKTEEVTTEKATEKETTEKAAAEEPATEITTTEKTTTEKATTEKATTEKSTTEKATTEKSTTEQEVNSKYITADITVTSGMGSEDIAKLVQDAGIIDDYMDFDSYLNENGYSQKLSVNTFSLNSNMTYEEIAKELTKGDKDN
jgi:outer membrane biosynthesis protein TonB